MLHYFLLNRLANKVPNVSFKTYVVKYCSEHKLNNNHKFDHDVGGVAEFDDLPGPKSYPVIGTLYKYLPFIGDYKAEALHKNADLNWRRYGSLVRETPGVRLLNVFDPEDIEAVFRQDERYPARRSHVAMFHYRTNKPAVYNTGGLLSTNGAEWWRLRSTFQKNFTSPQSVKSHVDDTDCIVTEFTDWIKRKYVSPSDCFLPYLNRLNLEVIGKVAFNERFNSFNALEESSESKSSKIIEAAFGSNSGIMKLDKGLLWKMFKTPLYKKLSDSQEFLEKISNDILLDRVTFFETSSDDDKSLLASFLKQPNLDLKDILGMMVDILMAAIDTTAYATSFVLYHVSNNPDIQKKIFSEVSSLLPTRQSPISPTVLAEAVYTKSCIKESLRLNPVSIGVGRLTQREIVLRGYLIPKDTVIVTQNMIASRLPQYVKDPLQFKPERWMRGTEDYENIHPFLSLPFGFGPRSCIARRLAEQNMCIFLMRMIREFKIEWMGEKLGVRTLLINKPDKPIRLSITPRSF